MTTTLTTETRNRAVAALRRAHETNRPLSTGYQRDGDKVCSCYILGEEFGLRLPEAGVHGTYDLIRDIYGLGLDAPSIWSKNDVTASFGAVADLIEMFEVVDEAEAICRDAVLVTS